VTSPTRRYTAKYPNATQAREFAENAARVLDATNVTRAGRTVEFDAPAQDFDGESTYYDVALSVGYYGGDGTTLNGRRLPRSY
jgi:hypothetical protein